MLKREITPPRNFRCVTKTIISRVWPGRMWFICFFLFDLVTLEISNWFAVCDCPFQLRNLCECAGANFRPLFFCLFAIAARDTTTTGDEPGGYAEQCRWSHQQDEGGVRRAAGPLSHAGRTAERGEWWGFGHSGRFMLFIGRVAVNFLELDLHLLRIKKKLLSILKRKTEEKGLI